MIPTLPPEFFEGIELFNKEQFYDCHEVLEAVWKDQLDPEKQLTQGIIQIAVALYHLRTDNYIGAEKLLIKGQARIRQSLEIATPIDVASLICHVEQALQAVQNKQLPSLFLIESKSN